MSLRLQYACTFVIRFGLIYPCLYHVYFIQSLHIIHKIGFFDLSSKLLRQLICVQYKFGTMFLKLSSIKSTITEDGCRLDLLNTSVGVMLAKLRWATLEAQIDYYSVGFSSTRCNWVMYTKGTQIYNFVLVKNTVATHDLNLFLLYYFSFLIYTFF